MNQTLFNRAQEHDIPTPNSYIKTAFDKILGAIYSSAISETVEDKIIEDMAYYVMKKLKIEEADFNWQTIEEFHYQETYSLATWYFDFTEVITIISKAKVSDNYDWEDIQSSVISIDKINRKIIENFKEIILDDIQVYSEEVIKKRYINLRKTS